MNPGTLNLLKDMEGLGLIHMQPPALSENAKNPPERSRTYRDLQGCCKNLPGGSVDQFLANCRTDKERELATEERD